MAEEKIVPNAAIGSSAENAYKGYWAEIQEAADAEEARTSEQGLIPRC